ncbi:MAG: acyl carrier protein [Verrucomicrobiales bacterium]|jgi:acyl carrier protein
MEQRTFIEKLQQNVDNLDAVAIDKNLQATPEWDSLAVLSCIAFIDNDYDIRISGQELRDCETLSAIFELVRSKSNSESKFDAIRSSA